MGLRVRGERGQEEVTRGPRAGIRSGILEPLVQILTSSQPSISCLYIRGQLGSWQLPCPNPRKLPITPNTLVSPSLALSTWSLANLWASLLSLLSVWDVCPHYLTQTYRTVTSSPPLLQASFRPWPSPRAPLPSRWALISRGSPQHSGLLRTRWETAHSSVFTLP